MQPNLFDIEEEESALENEDDLDRAGVEQIRGVSTFTSDWTVETILSQIDKGNILLDPRWQRRDAWNISRKSDLVESIILNYPVPPIVLAEQRGQRGRYIVIDGKQRLLALRQFAAEKTDSTFRSFRLSDLPTLSTLKGMTLQSMQSDAQYRTFVDQFENYPIRTVIVRGWEHESVLYSIFLRLNAGSAKLYPQELRQALHPGKFIDYIDDFASNSSVLRQILGNRGPDFRMRDNELALRFFAFQNFLEEYDGNLKHFLDRAVFTLNEDWSSWGETISSEASEFEPAYGFTSVVFDAANPFRKFRGNSYESRLNRAVFDIMMFAFSHPPVRSALKGREREVRGAYEDLCRNDAEFLNALETTTKSVPATKARMFKWSATINQLAGAHLLRPIVAGELLPNGLA